MVSEILQSPDALPQTYAIDVKEYKGRVFRTGQLVYMNQARNTILTTAFPLTLERTDHVEKSAWKMSTKAVLSDTGRLDATTTTRNAEAARGFTGGVLALVTDKDGNILHATKAHTFGVDAVGQPFGDHHRTDHWMEEVPEGVLDRAAGLAIIHKHAPKIRLWETIDDLLKMLGMTKEVVREVAEIAVIVATVTQTG